jgi:hypothetical protein
LLAIQSHRLEGTLAGWREIGIRRARRNHAVHQQYRRRIKLAGTVDLEAKERSQYQ